MNPFKFHFCKFVLLVILIIPSTNSFSQFTSFDYELSSTKVASSLVDAYGLLWVATEEGLNLYDGKRVHSFESVLADEKSLLNSNVNTIRELDNSDLLFISKDGISIFQRETYDFKRVKIPSPVSLVVDKQSNEIFITTSLKGIYILDFEYNIKNHFLTDPLNPFSISTNSFNKSSAQRTAKVLNDAGDIIFGTEKGLNVYLAKRKNFQRFISNSSGSSKSQINVISKITNNMVLIGYNNGINLFDFKSKKLTVFNLDEIFSNQTIFDILTFDLSEEILSEEDLSSNSNPYLSFILTDTGLYRTSINIDFKINNVTKIFDNKNTSLNKISLSNKGFIVWGNDKKEVLSFEKSGSLISKDFSNYGISNLCVNKNQEIFISTVNGLLSSKKNPEFLKYKGMFDGLENYTNSSDFRLRFYKWDDDRNWITLDHKTLRISKNGKFRNISLNQIVGDSNLNEINSKLVKFSDNKLFLFDQKHLYILNLDNFKISKHLFDLNDSVEKIEILEPHVYFSIPSGIAVFDQLNKKFKILEYDDLFNKTLPRGFSDIKKVGGEIWVGNKESGLHIFKGNINSTPILFSTDSLNNKRLSSFSVNKIFYDKGSQKTLISTQGDGLFVHSNKDSIFRQFTVNMGLMSNNIIDAKFGSEFIWLLTSKGINYFNPEDAFFYEIDKTNGFKRVTFNDNPLRINSEKAVINNSENQMFFENSTKKNEIIDIVGSDYILSFNTNDIINDDEDFRVEILNSKIFNYSQQYYSGIVKQGILEIDSAVDFIELELFTNNKFKRDQVEYFYSSYATNGEFVSNGFDNVIRIQSIPNYNSEIKIKAINKSGIQSDNSISFVISKTPPWYQRTETIISYFVLFFVGLYFFLKWRDRSATKKLEEERRNKELEEARKLQNSLLPKSIPVRKEYDISVYLKSATEVGGDYYDFIENDKNELFVICGDATGHGVVSGIMVSVTKAGLNGIKMADPSTILNNLNSIVKRVNFGRLRMSLSVAKINNGSVELSSAAMPPTYYYNFEQNLVEEILVPNLPLGGIEGERFEGVKKDFKKGDVMVMISDGLPELPNRENILLDYPKVFDCIKNNCSGSADNIKDALVDMSETWAEGNMNPDDITIVVIKKAS